jgi:RNA polymerase sigma-70 factor (ECF subfamily)
MLLFYLNMLDTEEEKLSFTDLYEQTRLMCFYVAMKITHNEAIAEDAVQNAFLSVIKHKDRILSMPCGKRRSQIVIITKNKAIDLMRSENLHPTKPIDETEKGEGIADNFDVSEYVVGQESAERLVNMIRTLPEIYKTAFELRYVHEKSNAEIAELLGISSKAVYMRISRARNMLQELVDKERMPNA